jgi:hypothetical protein
MKHDLQLSVVFSESSSELHGLSSFSCSCSYWSADYNLRLVLYGCKTLCLTGRKENRPSVILDKMLKKIFGARRGLKTVAYCGTL